jgi:hypothetical protein
MRPIPTSATIATILMLAGGMPAVAQQQPDAELAGAAGTAPPPASSDPNIDRAFIQPTAMTQPAGSLTYNNYELLLHGVTYGMTDNVQVTMTVLPPITRDVPLVGAVAMKGRVSPSRRLHLAAQGTLGVLHLGSLENDSGGTTGATVVSVGVGGYVSVCLRDDCASLLNASANYQYADSDNYSAAAHLLIYGGSLVVRATDHVKLLAEITSAVGRDSTDSSFQNIGGFLFSYGLRFHSESIAGDVGFIKPVVTGGGSVNDALVMGLPFVSVSYRWN